MFEFSKRKISVSVIVTSNENALSQSHCLVSKNLQKTYFVSRKILCLSHDFVRFKETLNFRRLQIKVGTHLTRHLALVAAGVLLVAVVPAVEVSVADLVPGYPQAVRGALYRAALVVALVLLSVVTVALVALVVAVESLVASEVGRDAVGRVELVISTRKLARLAVGGS